YGRTSAAAQTNCAPRRSSGTSDTWASTRSRLALSSPCRPAQRADSMPGMPFSASTHSPESSATDGRPVYAAIARAFSRAFSSNVAPVSATSGASGNLPRPMTSTPLDARIRASSRILPSFLVARTTEPAGAAGSASSATQRGFLQPGQLGAACRGQVEQVAELRPAERIALGGPLDLHEVAGAGAHHVHVRLGHDVFLVAQVEPCLAADDAHADRAHRADQRVALAPLALPQPPDRVGECDVPAGYRRGTRTAVGLEHVAVDDDRVLAQRLVVHARPERPADQAGDLLGAPAEPALDRLAVAAGVRRPGQHRVLGGHPAEPAPPPPARHVLGDARGTQHPRGAELHQ